MTGVNTSPSTRAEKAAATRARMVAAATEVFVEVGYAGARMPDIAERAGVAVQTLYYSFGTKVKLLRACVDSAVLGPEGVPPPMQEFWRDIEAARSGRAAIRAFVRGNAAVLDRAAQIDEVQKAGAFEPEIAREVDRSEDLRRKIQGTLVSSLQERFGLKVDLETATDLFVMLCGTEVYLTLKRRGWGDDRYQAWLTDTLASQLLARPGRR